MYLCETCKFPDCDCGTPRPRSSKYHVLNWPSWYCGKCEGEQVKVVKCKACLKPQPLTDFSKTIQTNPQRQWRCLWCQYPVCLGCKARRDRKMDPFEGDKQQIEASTHTSFVRFTRSCVLCRHLSGEFDFKSVLWRHLFWRVSFCFFSRCVTVSL